MSDHLLLVLAGASISEQTASFPETLVSALSNNSRQSSKNFARVYIETTPLLLYSFIVCSKVDKINSEWYY